MRKDEEEMNGSFREGSHPICQEPSRIKSIQITEGTSLGHNGR